MNRKDRSNTEAQGVRDNFSAEEARGRRRQRQARLLRQMSRLLRSNRDDEQEDLYWPLRQRHFNGEEA